MSQASTPPSRFDQLGPLLRLAWPILISQLAISGMGVVDSIMAGGVSPVDLAGVAVAFSIWLPALMFIVGVSSATAALVARAWGERNIGAAQAHIWQSLWLALVLGLVASALMGQADNIMQWLEVAAEVRPVVNGYLEALMLGLPAAAIYQILRAASEGIGHSKPVMQINLLAFFANIPLNIVFIHGHFGLPALGGAGCGWATATVMWLNAIALGLYIARASIYQELNLGNSPTSSRRPQWLELKQLMALGLPIGASVFAEVLVFTIVALLIGKLGAEVIAGHQIAMNVSAITFMLPLSISIAITVQVGQRLGAKQALAAQRTWRQALVLATAIAVFNATVMISFAWPITGLYTEVDGIRELAVSLLLLAAAYQISDALQVAAAGALRAYKDTQVTMYITLFAYWLIGLPLGYALGLTHLFGAPSGPWGFWLALAIALTVGAVLLCWRLILISRKETKAHLE
ncbi:MAG: MATE family efflux transporter [Cellvibrionaceae bacterium]|nr:MATE family efflux transporter [Cellvibrionaceae bacterium]MCV6627693.1 MATE family efflux transporter [Cellvibrionaceae bacterium]